MNSVIPHVRREEGKGMAGAVGGWSTCMWLYVIDGGKVRSLLSHGFYLVKEQVGWATLGGGKDREQR